MVAHTELVLAKHKSLKQAFRTVREIIVVDRSAIQRSDRGAISDNATVNYRTVLRRAAGCKASGEKELTVAEFARIQNSLNSCEFSYEGRYISFCRSPNIPTRCASEGQSLAHAAGWDGRVSSAVRFSAFLVALACSFVLVRLHCSASEPEEKRTESDYYRIVTISTSQALSDSRSKNWKPAPDSLALEVSGMAFLEDSRLAVAIRKGEVWLLSNVIDEPPNKVGYHRFASGLHEPLGLLRHNGSLLTVQRAEMTRLIDLDADDICDEYQTVATGWGVTGNYHEYAFGPKLDGASNLWLTLNLGLGLKGEQKAFARTNKTLGVSQGLWRGWAMMMTPGGNLKPMCAGMRSPSGLGTNLEGDMFYSDQQGNWVAANSLHHLRSGAFFHHPDSLASVDQPGSPIEPVNEIPDGLPFPEALKKLPILKPPAVWLPYKKVGQSATDIIVDASDGKFGPFAGQLFVGEFTQSSINRVYLEKIDGEYQGACFPFRDSFASAVLRMVQANDGSVFVGLSNRGWSSLGPASYGLQRLVWTGRVPMEIQEMRAQPDGFELVFTKPVDKVLASDANSYELTSHTYRYQSQYGSDEILEQPLTVTSAHVSRDGYRVRLTAGPLRQHFVHSLNAIGVRSIEGETLLHANAYYTLNRVPTVVR